MNTMKKVVFVIIATFVFASFVTIEGDNSYKNDSTNYLLDSNGLSGVQTWVINEVKFVSDISYNDPFNDIELDLILSNGRITYTIPAFWDGGNIWKARFVCTDEGEWSYITKCTDKKNLGLNDKTDSFYCAPYTGEYEIYKHGFIKTDPDLRYFVYNDGTPFFYLGDTHWQLGSETVNMIETIAKKRVEQGYTVYQSEPLGASFNFVDGITEADIKGLQMYDEKFKIIAQNGLVHANAQFFYPSSMDTCIKKFGGYYSDGSLSNESEEYLRKISRYWVARYSAYPVIWTLGQEVDNDFYWERGTHNDWNYSNNPYKLVAKYINNYDPYKHPLSAHQESTNSVNASTSAFRDVDAHNWWAVQWKPSITSNIDYDIVRDYWDNSQGKPIINYESRYCYLWTKNFGARAQGWISYLNGMYGYGWGGQDTWAYGNTYNEDVDSTDGVDIITSEEKKSATWESALNYSSAEQLGYMHSFFDNIGDWYLLIPRFENSEYFENDNGTYSIVASNEDNTKIVVYFYNFSDTTIGEKPNAIDSGNSTGTIKNLIPNEIYFYEWFDPVNGKYIEKGKIRANSDGQYKIPNKKSIDMVFYLYMDNEAPVIQGVENGKKYEVVVPIAIDENLAKVTLIRNDIVQENYENGDVIDEEGSYELIAKDSVGNMTIINFEIIKKEEITNEENEGPYEEIDDKLNVKVENEEFGAETSDIKIWIYVVISLISFVGVVGNLYYIKLDSKN